MIIRWPGVVKPESQSSALVQYVDIIPTLLNIAQSIPANESVEKYVTEAKTSYDLDRIDFDGKSFLNVLLGQTSEHGKYAYGIHNNIPEGPRYPIRSARTKDFSYIRNLLPNEQYIIKFIQKDAKQPYYPSWRVAAEHNDERAIQAIRRNEFRTAEELYDLKNDPWEMHNLINSPEHQKILNELRKALDDWMKQQGDPGAEIDIPISERL
jgi:uncharacterized sulfatase